MPRSNWLKGAKPSETPGRRNAKVHGEIPGYPVGSRFCNRSELSAAAVHAPLRAGIHGAIGDGAYSVVLSFGYEDDDDQGETFIYTGEGGREANLPRIDKIQGKESWETVQTKDQEWVRGNKALKLSSLTKKPVRVVRGAARNATQGSRYAPAEGYRYDGLYQVLNAWRETGKTGFETCRFMFERLPHQRPLPGSGAIMKSYSPSIAGPSRPTPELPVIHIQKQPLTQSGHACNATAGPSKATKPRIPLPPYRPPAEFLRSKHGTAKTTVVVRPSHTNRIYNEDDEDILMEWSEASRESPMAKDSSLSSGRTCPDKWDKIRGKQKLPSNMRFKRTDRFDGED